ncbi:MAG: hypothetical protein ABIU06_05735 [Anaerolineales bacterium]
MFEASQLYLFLIASLALLLTPGPAVLYIVARKVGVDGHFGAEGEPAKNVVYQVKVFAQASEDEISEMMKFTDTVAEIQNSLRIQTPVVLTEIEAVNV